MFRDPPSSTADPPPASATGIYPSQSLGDLFKSDAAQPTQAAYVPHPPGSYSPANQLPPSGRPAYGAPSTATPPDASATGAYPSQSLFDLFKSDAPQPARNPNAPHPPSTYTPSGQPYTPPSGQPSYGASAGTAPAAAAAPANSDQPSVGGVYPQQSLIDIFQRGNGAQ